MPKTAPEAPRDIELRGKTRTDAMLAPCIEVQTHPTYEPRH